MSHRPRIIMLTCEYGPIRAGGLGTMLTSLCQAIDRARFEPVVVMARSGHRPSWPHLARRQLPYGVADAYDAGGLEVWLLSNPTLDGVIYPEPYEHAGIKKTDEFGERVAELLAALDGDVLHLHDAYGYKALYEARRLGLPSILTVHRLHEDEPPLAFAELAAVGIVDLVTTVSHGYLRDRADFFARPGDARPAGDVRVVPNGIDLAFWSPEQLAAESGNRTARRGALLARLGLADRPTLAFVGRFDRDQKGLDVLLAAWTQLAEAAGAASPEQAAGAGDLPFNLIIAGEGDRQLTEQVAAAAAAFPAHLRALLRLLPHEEVRELLAAVDAVVIPSRYEPFGLIVLEAMAMGALPIAASVGGLRDVLEDAPFARGFPAGDAAALARCLEEMAALLARSEHELAAARRDAAALARAYSAERMARRYEALYDELLAEQAQVQQAHASAGVASARPQSAP